LFFIAVVAAAALFAIPLWIIQPFRPQHPASLNFALHLLLWSHWLAPALALAALIFGLTLWRRGPGKLRRSLVVIGLLFATVALTATRFNIYERMFRPDPNPHFLPPSQAWIGDEDMVMAVRIGGQARAYPIRQMAYHHVVNDSLAGQPIVATY
jgi:hypothetical protein